MVRPLPLRPVEGCQCIRRDNTLQRELNPNAALVLSATTTHQM